MKKTTQVSKIPIPNIINATSLLFLFIFGFHNTGLAATYYIDCAGSNTNSGTSPSSAWANTTPIQGNNFLKPGDIVEIKAGCTWTGPASHVIIDSAGTAANPIIIEAYGLGADPIFDGSVAPAVAVPNWSGWTVFDAANHIYVSNVTVPWVVNTIIVDGSSDLRDLNPSNQNETNLTTEPGSFFTPNAANNKIYVRMADNSNPNTHTLKFGLYGNSLGHDRGLFSVMDDTTQYVTVRHMHLIGSNGQGFTSGAPYTRFENCLSEFSARESFYIIKNAVQNTIGATYNTLLNCTGRWANSNFGQNFTIESSHVDLIDTTAEYGWMAGIDWLNYNSQTDASFGRCIRCVSHDNSQRSYNYDLNGYDPQIYIDGGHDIQIIASTVYMSLSGFYNNQANGLYNISVQSEHPDIKPDYNIYVLNSLVYGSNYIEFQTGALYNGAHTTMQAVDNINLINNTFVRQAGGYQILNWGNLDNTTSAKGIFLYNNIFYNPGGSTTGIPPALNLVHSDNNLYFNNSTGNQVYNSYTLGQWRSATGQDIHSLFANPDFVNPTTGDYHLQNIESGNSLTSPADGAADGAMLLGLSVFSDVGSTMSNATDDPDDSDIGYHYNSLVAGIDSPVTPSLPVVSITSPSSASIFSAGSNVTITITASETNGTINNISLFNGAGVLLGSSGTSPFNFLYNNILAGTYTFTAKATDANGVSVTSSPVTITVNPVNVAPVITNQPVNETATPGSTATFAISATGTPAPSYQWMLSVNNGPFTALAGQTGSFYTTGVLTTANNGYNYECVVTNSAGWVTSNVASLTVAGLPVVSITSPTNANRIISGYNLSLTANASESNGTIQQVAFYNGTTLLGVSTSSAYSSASNKQTALLNGRVLSNGRTLSTGGTLTNGRTLSNGTGSLITSTSSPYSFTWNNPPIGNYTIHAVATDVMGQTTTSNPITVSVTSWPGAYIANLYNGQNLTTGSDITINASAFENNGTISQVMFYNGSTLLGSSTTTPYAYTWTNVPAGTYSLKVMAEDNRGMFTQSASVTVTVS